MGCKTVPLENGQRGDMMMRLGVIGVEESVTVSPECLEAHPHIGRTLYHTDCTPALQYSKGKQKMDSVNETAA